MLTFFYPCRQGALGVTLGVPQGVWPLLCVVAQLPVPGQHIHWHPLAVLGLVQLTAFQLLVLVSSELWWSNFITPEKHQIPGSAGLRGGEHGCRFQAEALKGWCRRSWVTKGNMGGNTLGLASLPPWALGDRKRCLPGLQRGAPDTRLPSWADKSEEEGC